LAAGCAVGVLRRGGPRACRDVLCIGNHVLYAPVAVLRGRHTEPEQVRRPPTPPLAGTLPPPRHWRVLPPPPPPPPPLLLLLLRRS